MTSRCGKGNEIDLDMVWHGWDTWKGEKVKDTEVGEGGRWKAGYREWGNVRKEMRCDIE